MTAPQIWVEDVFVSAYDVDFQNRWKPAALFAAVQRMGSKHADSLGYSFENMAVLSRAWILSRIKIKFYQLPTAGETVTIKTAPKGIQQKIFFVRDAQVISSSGTLIAGSTTAWLVVDTRSKRLLPTSALDFNIPQPTGFIGLDETMEKIPVPEGMGELETIRATYNALDVMGHVNNARYAEWVTDCFPVEQYQSRRLETLQINYTNEVKPDERVTLCVGNGADQNGLYFIQGMNKESGKRYFEAAVTWADR